MKENARVWLILWQKDSHALPRQRLPGNRRQESGYYPAWNATMRWRRWSKTKPMNGNADLQTLKRIQTHLQVLQVHQRGLSGIETALLKTTRRACYWNVKRISKQANAIYQGSNVGRAWCPTQSEVWLRGFGGVTVLPVRSLRSSQTHLLIGQNLRCYSTNPLSNWAISPEHFSSRCTVPPEHKPAGVVFWTLFLQVYGTSWTLFL